MHIKRIRISNVRGFREVDLDLTRPDGSLAGWTVLAGRNGAGKSTLLQATALAFLGPAASRALRPSFADWVRVGFREASVGVEIYGPSLLPTGEPRVRLEVRWARSQEHSEPAILETHSWIEDAFLSVGQPTLGLMEKAQLGAEALRVSWFLAGYGPYRRLSGHAVDAQRLMEGPESISRVVSLFREDSSLVESVGWLREIYLQRLENKPGAAQLEKAVLALLNDGLLPDNVRVDQIDSEGLWVFQRDVRLPLRELSDGYRTVAALVMDIVRHLHRSFGDLQIERAEDPEGAFWRVLHEGVVLIDEVDLHLHVSWQKRVGFWLKRHFPNIQFLVTTHSPFICQAADPGGLIRLPAPFEERPVEQVSEDLYNTVVHGSLDEAVLTELFGLDSLYSEPTQQLRETVAQLEAKAQAGEATDEERAKLEGLRSQLPQTKTSDVEQALRALAAKL